MAPRGVRTAGRAHDRPRRTVPADRLVADDGFVLYDELTGRVHHLNATALAVLGLCSGERSIPQITRLVRDAFGPAAAPAEAVEACIGLLRAESLVR